jgi:predicted SnoaL-like aldol condensation-catalyzing enzyme
VIIGNDTRTGGTMPLVTPLIMAATLVFGPAPPAGHAGPAVAHQNAGHDRPVARDSIEARGVALARDSVEVRNMAAARGFYEDLWFSDHTERYDRYMADEYVVHDVGDVKNVTEPGFKQKGIADFLHSNGHMSGYIDYQIADGDLVATRWQWVFEPTSLVFKLLGGRDTIPIINVFRFNEEGRIVEIWNHRHDIDTGRANIPFVKGLAIGLLVAAVGWGLAGLQWLRARRAAS